MLKILKNNFILQNTKSLIRPFRYQFAQEIDLSSLDLDEPKSLIDPKINKKHFDMAIIGGGSAGLALAAESKKLGFKPILFDFVDPTQHGNTWGLGGTCVNVGCIPKKFFHNAGLLKEQLFLTKGYGYNLGVNEEKNWKKEFFSWESLRNAVQTHIKGSNYGFVKSMSKASVDYINAFACLKDKNTLVFSPEKQAINKFLKDNKYTDPDKLGQITADNIIIATGARPTFFSDKVCQNMRKYAISSDDLFSLKQNPGKTLVIGGGYIAVECAGLLRGLGCDVTMMTRGSYFRSMDQEIVQQIIDHIEDEGVKIAHTSLPYHIEKLGERKFQVKWKNVKTQKESQDVFETILVAVGRTANTKQLNLEKVGVKLNRDNFKIIGGFGSEIEKSSVPNIYALGDVLDGVPELTPVAVKSAKFLANRLRKQADENMGLPGQNYGLTHMNYNNIATTIFTPVEYGYVGLSEEKAINKYGKDNINVFLSRTTPLEENLSIRMNKREEIIKKKSFFKLITLKSTEKVLGIHFLGANAGEIIQGYAVAMQMGMTKKDLDNTVGIHPTVSEEFVYLKALKYSKDQFEKTSC